MVTVIGLLNSHPFVQKVFLSKSPTVVLFTDQQLADLRLFCCSAGDASMRSVLGVDMTFNLGPCFVTVVVYTCRAVVRNDTRSHPNFVGPMFLHWDRQYQTYRAARSTLSFSLSRNTYTVFVDKISRHNSLMSLGIDCLELGRRMHC